MRHKRAHERVLVQNVRDFPQTKHDSEINAPFLLNEQGDTQFFFQVFTKNSLIKNIFEEEKKFDSGTLFFFLENGPLLGVFWPRQYSRNQAINNSLNEAILLMSINEALISR